MANKSKIDKLGILAGGGDLPRHVKRLAIELGTTVHVINLAGFADKETAQTDETWLSLGELGGIICSMQQAGVRTICFAGTVTRPDFSTFKFDDRLLAELPALQIAGRDGDDALLRAVIAIFEKDGFLVIGANEFAGKMMAPAGKLGRIIPKPEQLRDLEKAKTVALATGALDIGQGAVVCNGLVLAVEAQEGTDVMLQRCAELPVAIRGTEKSRSGVLVKFPKPGQDTRVDLPTLGCQSIRLAAKAGLAGIGYATNTTFLIDQDAMTSLADELGMFLFGMES